MKFSSSIEIGLGLGSDVHVVASRHRFASRQQDASAQPSRQMRRIPVSKLPTAAPSKCETSSIKQHLPEADSWPLVSSRAYLRFPSPKSSPGPNLSQVAGRVLGLLRHGRSRQRSHRSHQWHHRNGQTHRQSLPKPTNYRRRMLLIAGGLGTSTHTQL